MISMSAADACVEGIISLLISTVMIPSDLLELQQLGGLHQVLELECTFRHVVRLAPLFNACDIVLDLHRYRVADQYVS